MNDAPYAAAPAFPLLMAFGRLLLGICSHSLIHFAWLLCVCVFLFFRGLFAFNIPSLSSLPEIVLVLVSLLFGGDWQLLDSVFP